MVEPVLTVEDLRVRFQTEFGRVDAVRGVSFTIGRERLGIVGESGSGKSMTGRSILRMMPERATLSARRMQFMEIDLLALGDRALRELRGGRISMILQDPRYALNPLIRIGEQIAEAYQVHRRAGRREARARALDMLAAVQIRNPGRVYDLYPHELSGGMGQRVMISMMLAPDPDLIIADEPTSALDVTVRTEVLRILDQLVEDRGLALIFISHDLNLVAGFCDRVLIMYAGRIVEALKADQMHLAQHSYTRGLLASAPRLGARRATLPVLQRERAWREPLGP